MLICLIEVTVKEVFLQTGTSNVTGHHWPSV